MTRQGRKQSLRRLRMEKLEDRQLLAVAAFQSELRSDDGGTPGELLVGHAFQNGDTFFLHITAQEFAPFLSGLRTASVDVAWDTGILEVVEEDFSLASVVTPNLPLYRSGKLDNAAGTIEDLSGTALLSIGAGRAIGNRSPETLAMIRMRVVQSDAQASIRLIESSTPTVTVPVMSLKGAQLRFDEELVVVASQDREPSGVEFSSAVENLDEQPDSLAANTLITPQQSETATLIEEVVAHVEVAAHVEVLLPVAEAVAAEAEQSIEVVEPVVATATTPMVDVVEPSFGYVCIPADHPQAAGLDSSLTISASSWFADQEERFRRRSLFKPHSN